MTTFSVYRDDAFSSMYPMFNALIEDGSLDCILADSWIENKKKDAYRRLSALCCGQDRMVYKAIGLFKNPLRPLFHSKFISFNPLPVDLVLTRDQAWHLTKEIDKKLILMKVGDKAFFNTLSSIKTRWDDIRQVAPQEVLSAWGCEKGNSTPLTFSCVAEMEMTSENKYTVIKSWLNNDFSFSPSLDSSFSGDILM